MDRIKSFFSVSECSSCLSVALLLVRLLMGYAFIMHGWGKIHMPLAWMGPTSTVPGFLQALAALSEFGGGIALIFGLFTRLSALGLICTMAVAVYFHAVVFGDPLVNPLGGPSYELAAVYGVLSLLLFVSGPGNFSLDKLVFGKK